MIKNYLMTPGPTPVPPEVLLSMAKPIIHHRTPQFQKILQEVEENLMNGSYDNYDYFKSYSEVRCSNCDDIVIELS